jgi:hypothetical protein
VVQSKQKKQKHGAVGGIFGKRGWVLDNEGMKK